MSTIPIAVQEVFHIGVCVADLDYTVAFFRDVLGAEVRDISSRDPKNQAFITGVDGIEVRIAYVDCHGQLFEFMEYGGEAELKHFRPRMVDAGHFHPCLRVADVEAAVAACRAYDERITTLSPQPFVVDRGPNKGNVVILVVLPDGMMIEFTGRAAAEKKE